MFVVVRHEISNQHAFFAAAESVVKGVPKGVKVVQFLPSSDGKQAICLWEATSVDEVKSYLEPKIREISNNVYYAVDSKVAMGLPVTA